MTSSIVVSAKFDGVWPFAADHARELWAAQGPVEFVRLSDPTIPVSQALARPGLVRRLIALGVSLTESCVDQITALREMVADKPLSPAVTERLQQRGVTVHQPTGEGFWGQSVAEFALGLTICGLRRIPQLHRQAIESHQPWDYRPPDGVGRPGARGVQFGDDPRFANGTIAGKRVRIVGMGNIGSRYASFAHFLGADVRAWDSFAAEPCFHRSGASRVWHLEQLVRDAQIFAPILPLTQTTRGLITAELIDALPVGCLVVMATRAAICDTTALRRRVLADELSLAADVYDIEPLPLNDPLLGRSNVVHTPHVAGRTIQANEAFAQWLCEWFAPVR